MEQIIYDFIRLEDDIIDDLCRDIPMDNNFERFSIGKSADFERKKLEKLLEKRCKSSGSEESVVVESTKRAKSKQSHCSVSSNCSCCQKRESNSSNSSFTSIDKKFSAFENDNVFEEVTKTSYRFDLRAEPRRKKSAVLCDELSRKGSCREFLLSLEPLEVERMKLDLSDPVITKSEVFDSDDESAVQAELRKSSEEMKIKIEMVQDIDIPFQADGEVDKSKLEELGGEKLKTTKMKFRVPKDIIDKDNKARFSKQLITYLSKRISSGASLSDGERLDWTITS